MDSVKSKDLGEIGNMLTNMVTELKSFDVQEEEKGFFGFFKKAPIRLQPCVQNTQQQKPMSIKYRKFWKVIRSSL